MATEHKSHVRAASAPDDTRVPLRVSPEDEVYGVLGALLGTLEVVSSDDALAPSQVERLRSAVRLCYGLQHQVEALLALAADDLAARLRRHDVPLRPMIEHAVRGALRGFASRNVQLHTPTGDWGNERVRVDPSRSDRMLKALAEALSASVGVDGALELKLESSAGQVALTLQGRRGTPPAGKHAAHEPTLETSTLLLLGATRLFAAQGGGFSGEPGELRVSVLLPLAGEVA